MGNHPECLFLAIFYAVLHISTSEFQCTSTEHCLCSTIQASFDIQCPFDEPQIAIKVKSQIVEVNCITMIDWNTQHLPSLNIGQVRSIAFSGCPVPEDGFLSIMERLGVNNTRTFKFILSSGFENITLTSDYFVGLENIEGLILSQNNIRRVDKNLFKSFKNLKEIDFRNNKLELTSDLFQYCTTLKLLDLAQNELTYLPVDLFKNLIELEVLYLWSNRLTALNETIFENLSNVRLLELSSNLLETLSENVFRGLKNLRRISLMKNRLRYLSENLFLYNTILEEVRMNMNPTLIQLPYGLFSNLTKLGSISINDCKIKSLNSGLFQGTKNLENVTFHHNDISYVSEDLFEDQSELQNLDLGHNKIERLPENVFRSSVKLLYLNLQNNLLSNLTTGLFFHFQRLETINLGSNRINTIHLETFRPVANLKKVILSNNGFELGTHSSYWSTSPFNSNINMEVLDLSHNNITTISEDWLFVMVKLRELNLSYNKISYLEFTNLISVSPGLTMDLSHNNISTVNFERAENLIKEIIPDTYTSANIRNVVVNLNNNPIECSCLIYDFSRYFERSLDPLVLTVLDIKASDLSCASPKDFIGLPVERIRPSMLTCSLEVLDNNATCPGECNCRFRPWDKSVIVDCGNKNLTSVPELILPKGRSYYNQTHVYLQGNRLKNAPTKNIGYENVTKLMLSSNNINEISWIPPKLKVLQLHNNNISHLSSNVLGVFNKSHLKNLSLGGNPWLCDCQALNLSSFLVTRLGDIQIDINQIRCVNNGKVLTNLGVNDLCPTSTKLIIAFSVTFAIVAIIIAMLTVLYYQYEQEIKVWLFAHNMCIWFVTEEEIDKEKVYDAFVSYSHKDEDFVMNQLLPVLEQGSQPYKLCLHVRDWKAGEFISKQITKSVEESRRTLVILSPNFLQSEWGKMEFRTAHTQAMSEGRARVIVILYGDLDLESDLDEELKAYIKTNTYVKWNEPWFWDKLRYALPHYKAKFAKKSQKNQNIMISLNDKLDLINGGTPSTPNPGSTPPAINIDPLLLKNNPLNFTPSEALTPPAECGLNPLLVTPNK